MTRGQCSECRASCTEKADNGHFYCDLCWNAWITNDHNTIARIRREVAAQLAAERQAKQEKEAELAEEQARAAELAEQVHALKIAERKAKEKQYFEARQKYRKDLGEAGSLYTSRDPEDPIPVVFWGICDIKYDPRLPERDRVKILELGDGSLSKFSNHGAAIQERFRSWYCMDSDPIKSSIMVDNKKLTHDAFIDCGLAHLVPQQFAYPRQYHETLAKRIISDLMVSIEDAVALKLLNRTRGAGVVICPARDLDATLLQLLTPPVGKDFDDWLRKRQERLEDERLLGSYEGVLDEQKLHYWANECPLFVAEQVCSSIPVCCSDGTEELFDGTLRVGFVLTRSPCRIGYEVGWLGGYWKLPSASNVAGSSGTIEDLHGRMLSSFNTVEKRTAELPHEHLREVCVSLGPALKAVFGMHAYSSPTEITRHCSHDPFFCAFVLARYRYSVHGQGIAFESRKAIEELRRMALTAGETVDYVPKRSVLSYIERLVGMAHFQHRDWPSVLDHLRMSLKHLPTNATSRFLYGAVLHEQKKYIEACGYYLGSITLNPDCKYPYTNLGDCWISLKLYRAASDAIGACLHRHPDSGTALHTRVRALCGQLALGGPKAMMVQLRNQALVDLGFAKKGCPSRWTEAEDELELWLKTTEAFNEPPPVLLSWKVYSLRP